MFKANLAESDSSRINSLWHPSLLLIAILLASGPAAAGPFSMLLEKHSEAAAGDELFHISFPNLQALLDSEAIGSSAYTQINVFTGFDTVGLAHDGNAFHRLEESNDASAVAGEEVVLFEYADIPALLGGSLTAGGFSDLNIGSAFDIVGFTYDGLNYHLLLESIVDAPAGQEIFHLAFADLGDLVDGEIVIGAYSQLNIGPNFDVAGFAYDESGFHLLIESNSDAPAGQEIYHILFAEIDDLIANSGAVITATQLNVNPGFDVVGLAAIPVPEPGFGLLVAWGVFAVSVMSRRNPERASTEQEDRYAQGSAL